MLAARLVPLVPRLARRVVDRIRAEVPGFDRLPDEVQDVEVAATARAAIRAWPPSSRPTGTGAAPPGRSGCTPTPSTTGWTGSVS